MEIFKIIEKKEKLPVAYRMIQCATAQVTETPSFNWRLSAKTSPEVPRFIIVGFQTGKNNNQEANPNPPANTIGYAVLLSDRLAHFQSDGKKFSFEY